MSLDYEAALEKLRQLTKNTAWHAQFDILALELQENLDKERLFGSTEQSRHDRYQLIYRINQLASIHQLNLNFNDLRTNPSVSLPFQQQAENVPTPEVPPVQESSDLPAPKQPDVYGKGKRWALIVGINEYEDTLSYGQLKVCTQDAKAIYTQLIAGGFKEPNIRLLADQRSQAQAPLRENILATLQNIVRMTEPDDLLLFYFSGHGEAELSESYLIPRNGRGVALHDTAVAISRVKEIIGTAKAKAKVLLLDACHSGANIQAKGKRPMSAEFINNVFKEAAGLAILSSCKEGQYSYEWPEKQCSAFTYYLIEALQGNADNDEKGFVTVQDVNRYITHSVKEWAFQREVSQAPTLHYIVSGDILLVEYSQLGQPIAPITQSDQKGSLVAEKSSLIQESDREIIDQYVGDLTALREGRVHQELTERLVQEDGIKARSKANAPKEDILERYRSVPLHALFLYTTEDPAIETYISSHWGELDLLSGDVCDIHPIVAQFKHPQDENAYAFMEEIDVLRNAGFHAYGQLPVLFFWDRQGATEYISFGHKPDADTIKRTLRIVFDALHQNPVIASVIRVKQQLQQPEVQLPLTQPTRQGDTKTVEIYQTPNRSPQFDQLYQIVANYTTDLDLQEICQAVSFSYGRLRGDSHAERAFSLTTQLDNQDRLADLAKELHLRLPNRFSDAS